LCPHLLVRSYIRVVLANMKVLESISALRLNTHRLSINFLFRWFRFSLRTWATAALTWAEGEHTWAEGEHARAEPEHAGAESEYLDTPWVSLRTMMWNPFWPPVCPGYTFLTEFCPRIRFCSLVGFLPEQILDPSYQRAV
jgi:hypothetical protein